MLEIAYNGRVTVSALEVTSVEGNTILRKNVNPKEKERDPTVQLFIPETFFG